MGYSDFGNFKLVDGYQLNSTDGYSFTSPWVDIHSAAYFDVTIVTTGGSPAGTFKLQKSNNLQWTGGNRVQPLQTGGVGAVDDTIDVPSDSTTGTVSVTIAAAGVCTLSQHLVGYRWFRVVYTATSNANTQLDIFVNWKK